MTRNRRRQPEIATQNTQVASSVGDGVAHADPMVVNAEVETKSGFAPIAVDIANVRALNWFRCGASVIGIDVNGRRICQRCGGVCAVDCSAKFDSADGMPKRIQYVKCQSCGERAKLVFSMNVPGELLTKDAKDSPLASVILMVSAIAERMQSLSAEHQSYIIETLQEAIDAVAHEA